VPPVIARALVLGTALAVAAPACRVDPEEFHRRIFACDTAAADPGCGTDQEGRQMACFAARQIGAGDFCAATCEPPPLSSTMAATMSSPEGAPVCLKSGIELAACRPSDDGDPAGHPQGACDRHELACYRTDLLSDEGVCTTLRPCREDQDCRDPVRSACAAMFLASLYADAPQLARDHLFCLQTGCRANRTACSPGETCLQEVIPASAHPPDICVPNCDSHLRCPPNFLCYRKVSTPIAPTVCIPGLLGFTCEDDMDCMLGGCVNNGAGYKVCTTGCASDAECRTFDGEQGKFLCVKNLAAPDNPGLCQTPDAYRGSICKVTSDCTVRNPDEICTRISPTDADGTCLIACDADGRCPPRAGIPHTCIPSDVSASGVCFPGYFGLPCREDGNCIDDLTCHPTVPGAPEICTRACSTTADCRASRWIGGDGWCSPLGICLPLLGDGDDCSAGESCRSGRCLAGGGSGGQSSSMRCAAAGDSAGAPGGR
jgi:hypothetical protein